jgi:Arc/MetJ-type ribon-helix-helix transcriptional regulator
VTQTLVARHGPQYGRVVSERTVTIEINQQQEQMLDRLVAEGELGETHGEVVRAGFVRFCEAHPELAEREAGGGDE